MINIDKEAWAYFEGASLGGAVSFAFVAFYMELSLINLEMCIALGIGYAIVSLILFPILQLKRRTYA